MLKKILSLITISVLLLSQWVIQPTQAGSNDGYFIVTAYYSPLPNQSKYIMGSYEAEVSMNGQWIRWAGGKRVFSGMLAAPWIYGFWTKIQLDGLGIWEVADRWGAIVQSWERNFQHDRIDLWVGHWEEWLRRAMYWGKRTVKGRVIQQWNKTNVNIYKIPAPKWATAYIPNNTAYKKKNTAYPIFNYWIWTKSKKSSILALQTFLKDNHLYNGKLDGVYNKKLMATIYNFQKQNKIVANWKNINAGYWSSQTRNLIWKKFQAWEFTKKEKKNIQIQKKIDIFSQKISSTQWVKELQTILSKMDLYTWKIDWKYNNIRNVILSFQLKQKIVSSKTQAWAGNFGPSTRKILKKSYHNYLNTKKQHKEKEKITAKKIHNIWAVKQWDISTEVRELQKALKQLWFFKHKDTAIFWNKTKQALIKYQLDRKIISNTSIYGAGLLWPKTRKQLIKDLSSI